MDVDACYRCKPFVLQCSPVERASRSLAETGFAKVDLARDVYQNTENKVFRFWTLFWVPFGLHFGSILAPFWSLSGAILAPLGTLWHPLGSFGVSLGYFGYLETRKGPFGSPLGPFSLAYVSVFDVLDNLLRCCWACVATCSGLLRTVGNCGTYDVLVAFRKYS